MPHNCDSVSKLQLLLCLQQATGNLQQQAGRQDTNKGRYEFSSFIFCLPIACQVEVSTHNSGVEV